MPKSTNLTIFHGFIPVPLRGRQKAKQICSDESGHTGGDDFDTSRHSATLSGGSKGVLHGVYTYLLQDEHGQISGA